jgi:GxxExxY protein
MNTDELDRIAAMVVDAAYKVHSQLGPGLLESTYEACLEHELKKRGLTVARQVPQPFHYDDIVIDAGYRLDLIVNDGIIIELKAVENLLPIHQAQLLTYLKLSGRTLGFLINFNVSLIKDGIRRLVRNHPTK